MIGQSARTYLGNRETRVTRESTTEEFFYLPQLPRLLPYAYHPQAARIEIASNGWVRHFLGDRFPNERELLRFLRQRNGLYGPLTVPAATDRRARDIADWYQFVTVIDSFVSDRTTLGASHDGARQVFADIMADFQGGGRQPAGETPEEPGYGAAARDLWHRISPGLSDGQVRRLADSLEAFLRGCAAEIQAKLTADIPDYETCMTVREDSFGCEFLKLLTEYGAGVDMTAHTTSAEFVDVHIHAMRQLILVNDLLSWRKEHADDDVMTTVRVLIQRYGMGLQPAVDELCRLVEYHENEYIAARDRILSGPLGAADDVRAYLGGLDYLIGGSQEFEYLTPRYFGDGFVWDGTTSGWVSLTAPVARFLPAKPAEPTVEPAPALEPTPTVEAM
jgi:hypothetical protein